MWNSPRSSLFARFRRLPCSVLRPRMVRLHPSTFHSRITSSTSTAINTHCNFSTDPSKIAYFAEKPCKNGKTHDVVSSNSHLFIENSLVSKCSHYWEKKADNFAENSTLQDILKEYGHLSPETTRRFWRVSVLNPNDFAEILMGFGPNVVDMLKTRFLWKLFRWASTQCKEFTHHPKSFEIMAALLMRARMLEDAESLLLSDEARGAVSGDGWMFSEIIQAYVEDLRLENSIALYDKARERGLVLSGLCYKALLDLLTRRKKADLAVRVYADMIDSGLGSCSEDRFLEFVVETLSKKGRTLEAVNILKKLNGFGVQPSAISLTAVVEGYSRKKDYDDALNFLKEWKHVPEAKVCNKIISSLCRNLGSEEAWMFVQRLEAIGFGPDGITFGILISQSCSERKLRSAFIYLSESCSRRVELDVHDYNALISGLFKEGMFSPVKNIIEEMTEKGLIPGLSTFKVMLAGYCKYRKFDDVKQILREMINCGITSLSCAEDSLSKAFLILGLDSSRVKVKRDNDLGLAKAEFFDSLGNGLYLEADVEEYDKTLDEILEKGIIPDFDSFILEECCKGDVEAALKVKDEAVQWGKELSSSAFSRLIECLCASSSYRQVVIGLLDEITEYFDVLDIEVLNLLIRYLGKNGVINSAWLIMDRLLKRQMMVESDTYTALLLGFCKEKNIDGLRDCLQVARRKTWLPGTRDIRELVSSLCKFGLIKDTLELFESILETYPNTDLISVTCNAVIEEFCNRGFSDIGCALLEEFFQRGHAAHVACYTSLIEGFMKEKKFSKAVGMIDQLLEKGTTPSTGFYQLAVPLLFKSNGEGTAMSLKRNILNAQSEDALLVYGTLVNELCKIGKMKKATSQWLEMLGNEIVPDNITLNALIQGYCHVKNLRAALEILCFMIRNGIDLSFPAYRSLIRQFCAHSQVLRAVSLQELTQLKSESQLVVLRNILLFYLFQSRHHLPVKAVVKKILEKHLLLDPDTYNILIYGFYKCGDATRSVKLLNTMITKGMKPNNRNLRATVCYLCSNGEFNEALQLSKVMECSGWKHGPVILYVLTEGLLRRGGIFMAGCFLDRMEENNMIPDNVNLDHLVKKFCEHGYIKKAVDLLNVMLKKGSVPNEISYSLVVKGLAIGKLFDHALDFHSEMRYKTLEPSLDSCKALVCGLCDNGRTDDARKFLGEMLRFGQIPTGDMYSYVIDKYYAAKNLNKASELLQEMQQVGYSPNFETYWSLISNLSHHDKVENDDDKGFLSRLLAGNDFPAKNHEDIILSAVK